MSAEDSVTFWLDSLKAGDRAAIGNLWNRYFQRMLGLARLKLGDVRRAAADEEDIALSAFDSFCQGMEIGDFAGLQNREELWRLLVIITVRKALNVAKHETRQKRGGDRLIASDDQVLRELISREPTPAVTAAMDDECRRLFDLLDDDHLRQLVMLKLEGHTNTQCATHLGRTRVTVQRMLKLIQETWLHELAT